MALMNVQGVDINYADNGSGEALVFMHGYTGSHNDWRNQVAITVDSYRTIAVDHRGHGGSSAPGDPSDYTIRIFAEDVYELLTKLGIQRYCLIGHSMGGFMALQSALDHPEGLRGLILVDTSSGEWDTAPGYAEFKARLHEIAKTEGLEAAFEYDAENNPVRVEKFKKHPELREIARHKVLNTSLDGFIHVANSFGAWPPVTDRLNEISVPTLIVLGEEDAGFIRASKIMNERIRNSELVVIENAGHNPHEENIGVFNRAFLDFLPRIQW
ncbi:MAG: alpha/beta hydrolase [Proteobacteria bacterium]|nr:alpha/beta hydrolase [Pseudomonadota bacterium]MBU1387248.1 alpha/beta hydrolase [Pseudomonadota bacterium]MBU1544908.1 alpha/beta hydrolase [Pseudomonadota bacterium]MBU2430663.1 alpha/beta hydrolase [Pseudomonadota bacterium]MBU2482523.1 alpha/beta hydrolase [Pseudomonadota bacterium]